MEMAYLERGQSIRIDGFFGTGIPIVVLTQDGCLAFRTTDNYLRARKTVEILQGGEDLSLARLNFPLCIIFGSEGKGVREGLIKQADYKLTLPMQGANLSLNVAMSVGIFCYEAYCQRKN